MNSLVDVHKNGILTQKQERLGQNPSRPTEVTINTNRVIRGHGYIPSVDSESHGPDGGGLRSRNLLLSTNSLTAMILCASLGPAPNWKR